MMSESLRRDGFTVIEATHSQEALRLFTENRRRVDMLVTDVSLPGANGCEIAKAMVREKPDLHVLFVSGHAGAEVCKFYGFPITSVHFLRKPFRPADLASRVQLLFRTVKPFPAEFGA